MRLAIPLVVLLLVGCNDPLREGTVRSDAAPGYGVAFPDGSVVRVEIAADPESRGRGLMYRSSLGDDRGMLFLFPAEAMHSFWMKNTIIALDMVWIDGSRAVVHIETGVPPCESEPCPSYAPGAPALHVLELAAGQVAARGLRIGDVLEYRGGIENIAVR